MFGVTAVPVCVVSLVSVGAPMLVGVVVGPMFAGFVVAPVIVGLIVGAPVSIGFVVGPVGIGLLFGTAPVDIGLWCGFGAVVASPVLLVPGCCG